MATTAKNTSRSTSRKASTAKQTSLNLSTSSNNSTMTTTTRKAKAVATLTPVSFTDDSKLIRYTIMCNTPALKKEFPGHEGIRVAAYIGGNAFINPGLERDDSIESIKMLKKDFKAFLDKHDLPDITEPTVFGASRQLVAMKNAKTKKQKEALAKHTATFNNARKSVSA